MNKMRKYGAVLVAIVALALMPAFAFASGMQSHQAVAHGGHGGLIALLMSLSAGIAGTVVVTYSSFVADNPSPQFGTAFTGGTTAPTALQAAQVNRINALFSFTDADTSIVITHNWNLSAAAQAANEPDFFVHDTALGNSGTQGAGITWTLGTNSITGTRSATAGGGRTQSITLRLPATPGN